MKLIKKIAAIMLSVMMVLGMASVVSADETTTSGTYNDTNGTITIENAIKGQTYTIYRILKLESFSKTDTTENYAYKAEENWDDFIGNETTGGKYLTKDDNDYVTWKTGADVAEFAKVALNHIRDKSIASVYTPQIENGKDNKITVKFNNFPLGYYLVDSSVGALCGLTTTNPTVIIQEKNGVPTVDKKIEIGSNPEQLVEKNSVNLGESVIFKTTINVQPGVKNYVLYDKIDSYFDQPVIMHICDNAENKKNYVANTDFKCIYAQNDEKKNKYTFKIEFLDNFYQTKAEQINEKKITTITIYYSATVKSDAPIKTAMNNKTWLTYGAKNTESNKSETNTYTFGIPVFKYTGSDQALKGAKFKLYTDELCNNDNNALKFKKNNDGKYRYVQTTTQDGDIILTSPENGYINIEGIKEGVYYLKEIEAPKGYNKLKNPIKVVISEEGTITVDNGTTSVDKVKVQNNTGTILPTTGGNGTSLIYLLGAVLALVSGVVLITKQRMKNS